MHHKISKAFILIVIFSILFISCEKESIKIGMVASLTGKQSQLSIDARNAVDLAVDELNKKGGINGHLVELIVKDDENSIEIGLEKHQEFKEENVSILMGHMTSTMSEAILAQQNGDLLFISPSISNEKFTGIDDYFLRTCPLTIKQGDIFLEYIANTGLRNITLIYDTINSEYSTTLSSYIKTASKRIDNLNITLIPFDSGSYQLSELLEQVDYENTDSAFIIAQATDTAFIAQKLKQGRDDIELLSVSWSMTKDLIENGGKYVEGMHFVGLYHAREKSEALVDFENSFYDKYGYEPSFISILAYDSFNMLAQALKNTNTINPDSVKKSMLEIDEFIGLEESFSLDKFGDSNRNYLIYELKEGQFLPIYN